MGRISNQMSNLATELYKDKRYMPCNRHKAVRTLGGDYDLEAVGPLNVFKILHELYIILHQSREIPWKIFRKDYGTYWKRDKEENESPKKHMPYWMRIFSYKEI